MNETIPRPLSGGGKKGGHWPFQECDFGLAASMLKVQFGCLATVDKAIWTESHRAFIDLN
jgi:hypothetical protein